VLKPFFKPHAFSPAFAALLGLVVASCGNASIQLTDATPRSHQLIDADWRFSLDSQGTADFSSPALNDADWRKVHLPHDFVVEQNIDQNAESNHGYRPKGVGWYRKSLMSPANPNGRVWLEFDGVYRDSKVWINGTLLGEHQSGYTSFYYDVTPYLQPGGRNEVVVRVDANGDEGWWYEGGGVYRHVWLTTVPTVHVDHWGTFVTTPVVTKDSAQANIETDVRNEATGSVDVSVENSVLDGGKPMATTTSSVKVPAGAVLPVTQTVQIAKPQLWSPDENQGDREPPGLRWSRYRSDRQSYPASR
jgi:beta-galactosidase